MEANPTRGQLPQHTLEFLKKRKFLTVMPLLILPFLTLAFWALGGGRTSASIFEGSTPKGLNATLPQAQFKDQKIQDKMDVYQSVKTDSAGFSASGVSESFIQSMGLDAASAGRSDSMTQRSTANLTGAPSSADANEAKIQAKLAAINQQINQPEAPNYSSSPAQPANADVKRLGMMMRAMNGGGESDPEIRQLTQMLQQINDIQNPDNANSRRRNESINHHGRVYAVMAAGDPDDPDQADRMSVSYASYKGGRKSKQHTAASSNEESGNTIKAVVHDDQTLVSGAVIKLRLMDGIYVNGKMIPKGSFVYGTCALNNERLDIKIVSIRYLNNILPVALTVYDLDGMEGLYVPGSIGRDAAKNGVGDAVQSMQVLSMNQSVGAQAASAGVEAAKGLFNRKVKQIKVKVKAGYEVLLKDNNDRDN